MGHSHSHGGHGHSHGGGDIKKKMLAANAQGFIVYLTSHLSAKDGNELDLFIEDSKSKAATSSAKQIEATITIGGVEHKVAFDPAPDDERPADERGGKDVCSHYVTKASFMKDTDTLQCTATFFLGSTNQTVKWENFDVKKYAHHEDHA